MRNGQSAKAGCHSNEAGLYGFDLNYLAGAQAKITEFTLTIGQKQLPKRMDLTYYSSNPLEE